MIGHRNCVNLVLVKKKSQNIHDKQAFALICKNFGVIFTDSSIFFRSIVLCALAAYSESGRCIDGQIRCLDALGATGVSGLAWARNVPKVIKF